jgi:hypothetical protein
MSLIGKLHGTRFAEPHLAPTGKQSLFALTFVAILATSAAAQATPASEEKIRELIQSSEIVPIDYRQHISISEKDARVLISVYKAPDAQQSDCRIDAILMAEKVSEAAPGTAMVEVFFYDLAAQDKVWEVDVPTASVSAYAQGKLSKSEILHAAKLTSKPANSLASSYSGQSYRQIIQKLGVLEGPAQDLRALALVRIDDLASQGKDTGELKSKYLHIEDLMRRGDLITMRHELKQLTDALELLSSATTGAPGGPTSARDLKLQSMLHGGANPQ